MGFIVVQWENENSMSVLKEKKKSVWYMFVCLPVLWLNAYAFWVGEYVCDVMVCVRELWLSNGVLWVGEYVCEIMLCVCELCLSSGVVWVGEYDRDMMMFVLELIPNGLLLKQSQSAPMRVF